MKKFFSKDNIPDILMVVFAIYSGIGFMFQYNFNILSMLYFVAALCLVGQHWVIKQLEKPILFSEEKYPELFKLIDKAKEERKAGLTKPFPEKKYFVCKFLYEGEKENLEGLYVVTQEFWNSIHGKTWSTEVNHSEVDGSFNDLNLEGKGNFVTNPITEQEFITLNSILYGNTPEEKQLWETLRFQCIEEDGYCLISGFDVFEWIDES